VQPHAGSGTLGTMAYGEVSPDELRARIAKAGDVYVLDVREPDEIAAWAFPDAIHIPLGQLQARVAELPRDREIVCLCHAGVRSAAAAGFLDQQGYDAVNLTGGLVEWLATQEG
jgi:rhodanese-related sulfurtransferase